VRGRPTAEGGLNPTQISAFYIGILPRAGRVQSMMRQFSNTYRSGHPRRDGRFARPQGKGGGDGDPCCRLMVPIFQKIVSRAGRDPREGSSSIRNFGLLITRGDGHIGFRRRTGCRDCFTRFLQAGKRLKT